MRQITHGMPQGSLPQGVTRGPDGKFVTMAGAYDTLEEAMASLTLGTLEFKAPPEPATAQPVRPQPTNLPPYQMLTGAQRGGASTPPPTRRPRSPEPKGQSGGGFMDRLTNPDTLGGIGSMMLAMSNNPNLAQMGASGMQQMQTRRQANRTIEALRKSGKMTEDQLSMLENNPEMIKYAAAQLFAKPDSTALQKDYLFAKQSGFKGSFEDFMRLKSPGTTVNIDQKGETKFSEAAGTKDAERFDAYVQAGNAAVTMVGALSQLQQLSTMAPNGPLSGSLAEMFPGMNTAGAAFTAVVSQLAPTLRVPGSGAASDKDMELIMNGLPRLRNYPEANQMIISALREKANIDIKRQQIASAALTNEISRQDANKQLNELNQKAVLDTKLRTLLSAEGDTPQGGTIKVGDVVNGYRFKGGNPNDQTSWEKI